MSSARNQACLGRDKHCSDTTCAGNRAGLGAGQDSCLDPARTPLRLWQQDHLAELGLLG